jgi:hypothetical protein
LDDQHVLSAELMGAERNVQPDARDVHPDVRFGPLAVAIDKMDAGHGRAEQARSETYHAVKRVFVRGGEDVVAA